MSRIERGAAGSSGRGVHVVSSTTVRRSGAATGGRTGSTRRMGGATSPCPGQGRTGSSAPIERGYRVRGRILRPWPRCTAASGRGSWTTSTSGPTATSSSAASLSACSSRHPGRDHRQLLRLGAGRDDGRRRDQGRDAPGGVVLLDRDDPPGAGAHRGPLAGAGRGAGVARERRARRPVPRLRHDLPRSGGAGRQARRGRRARRRPVQGTPAWWSSRSGSSRPGATRRPATSTARSRIPRCSGSSRRSSTG